MRVWDYQFWEVKINKNIQKFKKILTNVMSDVEIISGRLTREHTSIRENTLRISLPAFH